MENSTRNPVRLINLFLLTIFSIASFNATSAAMKNDLSPTESTEKSIFANTPSIDFEWKTLKSGDINFERGALMIKAREEI
ncbi:hypothetical protein [Paraburkholderia denitrificans]|uniref:hypothetical protein n=1 Tax=Paraburkholderia denitrificans TaxID=694025 RepID=UPI00366F5D8B